MQKFPLAKFAKLGRPFTSAVTKWDQDSQSISLSASPFSNCTNFCKSAAEKAAYRQQLFLAATRHTQSYSQNCSFAERNAWTATFVCKLDHCIFKLQTTASCLIACNCRLEWAGCTIYQVFFFLFFLLEHSLVNLYLVALAEISSIITKKNIATVQLYVVMKVSHMDESFGGGRHGTDTDGSRTPSSLHVVFYTMLTANWLY